MIRIYGAMTRAGARRAFIMLLVGILLLATFPPPASAATQYTWTTTADFDGGDKSDPGPDYFTAIGVDQPTYSFESKPSAIYVSAVKRTYIVYQAGGDFLPYIIYYDHRNGVWSDEVQVNDTNPVAGDGHGAPSVWVDSAGYIYVFFGAHATPLQVRRSVSPYSISSWISLPSPSQGVPPHNQATYPHLFEHKGYMYLFYREGTAAGGDWGYRRSNDRGSTWSTFTTILDFGTDGAYISDTIYVPSQKRVYYTFPWDNRTSIVRHNVYACYWDLTTGTQYGIDGVNLGSVVTLAEADADCRAVYSGSSQVWYTLMKLDSSSRPYILYTNGTGAVYNTINVSFVHWSGSSWSTPQNLALTDGIASYSELKVNSATDVEAFIVTSGFRELADPADDFSGDLERWTWDGATWTFAETIMSEANAGNPVNRPFRPLYAAPPLELVFDTWSPKGLLLPEAKMWAWGENGFLHRAQQSSGTYGVETVTDGTRIPSGVFAAANGLSDTFALADADAVTWKWSNIRTGDGTAGSFTRSIVGGAYTVAATDASGTGRLGATLRGNFGVEGSIDLRMGFKHTVDEETSPFGNVYTALCLFTQPDECDTVSGDYYYGTEGVFIVFGHLLPVLQVGKRVGGVLSQVGSDSTPTCEPCWFRITKAGTLFTFYYSPDNVNWTQDEQQNIPQLTASTWYVHASIFSNGVNAGDWAVETDDYLLASGTLPDGYRRTASSWRSPVIGAEEIARNVTLGYVGASANAYIDSVAIVDANTDEVLWENTTDVASGLTLFNDIGTGYATQTALNGHDFQIRVTLASVGNATVTVQIVQLWTERSLSLQYVDDVVSIFWIIFFAIILTVILFVAWQVKRWRGV